MKKTKVIGITGNLCSGKSILSNSLLEKGYKVINTDLLAKEIITNSKEVQSKIKEAFGENSFDENGRLNSAYISDIVFNTEDTEYQNLSKLNAVVHPLVIDKMADLADEYEAAGEEYVFIESALIYELDLEDGFDYIICVSTSDENAIERAVKNRNLSEEKAKMILGSQMNYKEKAGLADFAIDNNKSIESFISASELILSIMI